MSDHDPHDFRKPDPAILKSAPLLEAEMSLLGTVLYDNEAVGRVEGLVRGEHFLEPFNGAMFDAVLELAGAGRLADAVTVSDQFAEHPAFIQVGGLRYLADLIDHAPPAVNAPDYARMVRAGWQRRKLISLAGAMEKDTRERGDVPVEDLIEHFEAELLAVQLHQSDAALIGADDAASAVFDGLRNPDKARSIKTHIGPLDRALGGITPGHLLMLAGRPSMGKSALASTMALNVARNELWPDGQRVGVIEISLEMDVDQMTRRHLSDWSLEISPRDAPTYRALKDGEDLTVDGLRLAEHVGRQFGALENLKMAYRPGLTVNGLRGLVRRQASKWARMGIRVGLVIVDHVGLMRVDGPNRGRYDAQTTLAIEMKELAGVLGVGLVALVQLSRQIETRDNKRPLLADMRDSGAWEENADAVIGVYRDAYYAEREVAPKRDIHVWESRKLSQDIDAILLKLREGKAGTVTLWGDMGRNAIRGSRPENYHGDQGARSLLDLLDPDVALPRAATPRQESDQAGERVLEDIAGGMFDGREEPPLDAYSPEDFA